MVDISEYFTAWDWATVVAYLLLTTLIGHFFSGKQATIRDFFLAGRSLPWPAVSGSIIATAISAITFVGVPSIVFATKGNFTYLQLAIGSIAARIIVAKWFVPAFYEREIYSPYDYMENKLGPAVGKITTLLFFLGSTLAQGVRVFATAIVLEVVTGLRMWECIGIIGAFAIIWTWMGGMATVIWTDVVQFFVFVIGGILAIYFITSGLGMSFGQAMYVAESYDKLTLWDLTADPRVEFTLWAGLFGMTFQNLAAYGTDQLNTQRMFCCRNQADASKAIYWSCLSEIITIIMLSVGALLFVFYQINPLSPDLEQAVKDVGDRIFPVYIMTEMPSIVRGLLVAGVFAAAISSLDSILAALSQTSMTTFYKPYFAPDRTEKHYVLVSRLLVLAWGIILCTMAWSFTQTADGAFVVTLAFTMVGYTYGPLLGTFLLAFLPFNRDARGLLIGIPITIAVVFILNHLYLRTPEATGWESALHFPWMDGPAKDEGWKKIVSFAWLYPIGTAITLGFGILLGRRREKL